MKKYAIIMLALICLLSCDNEIKIESGLENFEVTIENTSVSVGDMITFNFQGNPNLISFYSGEPFHQYKYREGRVGIMTSVDLSFMSAHPSAPNPQKDQLSLMISTNYEDRGNDYNDILAANWTDITDRFQYSTSGTYVESGIKEITDAIEKGKTFHFGLKYVNKMNEGNPRRWLFQSFGARAQAGELSNIPLSNPGFTGFRLIEQHSEIPSKSSITASIIILDGNPDSPHESSETWALSYPMYFGDIEFGPDRPIGIKGYDQDIESFTYTYSLPGTYDVVFLAKNVTVDQEKEVYKHIQITVSE